MKYLAILFGALFLFTACKKDKSLANADAELFVKAQMSDGFTWYKNTDALLPKSSGSGHNFTFLRTRYNEIAATKLDSEGKIQENAVFPEGALIVKELINEDESLGRYAILFKASENENADGNGWVWGYINADQTVSVSATEKGTSCISCHQQTGAIDYMLMNSFFP